MHTRVALYRVNEGHTRDALMTQAQTGLAPRLAEAEGFGSYGISLDLDDPMQFASISQWETEEAARQGANVIADWVSDEMPGALTVLSTQVGEFTSLADHSREVS